MLVRKLMEIQAMLGSGNIEGAQRRVKYLLNFFSKTEKSSAAAGILEQFRKRSVEARKRTAKKTD